jgi:Sec-independent protein secretion pathway component TatC
MGKLLEVIGIALVVGIILAIPPYLFMLCFNFVAPVFYANAPQLTFIQSLAAVVLARIIFGFNPAGLKGEKKEQ